MRKTLFFLLLVSFATASYAQNYQLHSVYIYSFIRYIQWPEDDSPEFVIGVLGDSPILPHLQKMAEVKKAGDRKIVIKLFNNTGDITPCAMLFKAKESEVLLEEIMPLLNGGHTMLITEEDGLATEGSNINFVLKDSKLVFELNSQAMEKSNLKVSTELTRLAVVI